MTRSTARYPALLAIVIVLFYWKTLLTNQFSIIVGAEGVNMTYAWLHFWVRSIQQGHIPLWDPNTFAGGPFAAAMLPSVFYPLHLLFALVPAGRDGLLSTRFYHEYFAFMHLLCAWFTFALLRELHRSRFASFVGACVFPLSGLLVRMIWPPYIESCIWLPAIFLFLLRAWRAERRGRALAEASLCGLCLGMSILTGGMAFFVMQAIFTVTAAVYFGFRSRPAANSGARAHWIRMGLILGVAVVVAGGLSAVQLIPANEYSRTTLRFIDGGAFPSSEKIPYDRLVPGMWPQSIVSALLPDGFGGRIGGEEIYPFYVGVFPFFLAMVAIWKCGGNIWVRYLTGLAALSFIYSLGELSPLHGVLYALVPFLWLSRAANRFLYLVSFALAILAAFGLDTLLDAASPHGSWNPARRILKWVAICAGAALFLPALFAQLSLSIWNAFSLLLILGACAFFLRLTAGPSTTWLRAALVLFILFDLAAFAWIERTTASLRKTGDGLEQMVSLKGPAEFIKSRPGLNRVRVAVQPEPNIGDVYGVHGLWGGGATILTEYSRLGAREDLLNVRYYIRPVSAPDPGPVYKDSDWKVYENKNAYPRAWVVHQSVVEPVHDAAFRRLDGINPRETAVLESPLPRSLEPRGAALENVHFQWYDSDSMAMDVDAASGGLLVLSEMYYPGWKATVNGRTVKIYRTDGALRGIPIGPGQNKIELDYTPASFLVGAAVSLLTFASVLTGWIYARRTR